MPPWQHSHHTGADHHQPVMVWQWQGQQACHARIGIGQVAVIRAQYLCALLLGDGREMFDLGTSRAGFLAVGEEDKCFHSA